MKATLNDLQLELWLRVRNSGKLRWETKNGTQIPIKDMSDSHLINAINMLKRIEEEQDYEYFLNSEVLGSTDSMDYYD